MTLVSRLRLRRATHDDVAVLERWDTDPDVIAATTDDDSTGRAFGGLDWSDEISQDSDVSYHLIAEVDGRPVGAMQVCDPHAEPTHYWEVREEREAARLGERPSPGSDFSRSAVAVPVAAFEVDDLKAEAARLAERGVAFTQPPTPSGPVVIAVFADTCGNLIQMYQRVT